MLRKEAFEWYAPQGDDFGPEQMRGEIAVAQRYKELSKTHIEFITTQKLFFVGTATAESRVNVSPKGMDSFRAVSYTHLDVYKRQVLTHSTGRQASWLTRQGQPFVIAAQLQSKS